MSKNKEEKTSSEIIWEKQMMKSEKMANLLNAVDVVGRNKELFTSAELDSLRKPIVKKLSDALEEF